jgi:DNA-binding MarR family transcriptional regulator
MVQSVANWTSYLQSVSGKRGHALGVQNEPDPAIRVLMALKNVSALPLTDLVKATALPPEAALDAVEKLRAMGQVEVVEQGEEGSLRLLRLTPAGFGALADLPPA